MNELAENTPILSPGPLSPHFWDFFDFFEGDFALIQGKSDTVGRAKKTQPLTIAMLQPILKTVKGFFEQL